MSTNKIHEDYSELPSPDLTKRTTWVHNPSTGLKENVEMTEGNFDDSSPGDVVCIGDLTTTPKTLTTKATLPAEFSANATEEGRIQVADGSKFIDVPAAVTIVGTAAPTVTDGWEGAFWWDKTNKLMYGPKGFTAVGQWGPGRLPYPPVEYLSAEITTGSSPVDPARTVMRLSDIDEVGGFTEDATGVTVPVAGVYRVHWSWQATNNSGTEAVFNAELRVNDVVPTTRDRQIVARFETSRWPIFGFTTRLTLAANDVLSVVHWSVAGQYDISGNVGGVLIERIG